MGSASRSRGKWARLGEVCEVIGGATPKTTEPSYWDGDIKWITPAEINLESHVIYDTVRHLTEEGFRSANLRLMPARTVLLTTRAPIGKVAIAGAEMCCNQGFKCLVCSEGLNEEWLYRYLKFHTERLQSLGTGATFKELSKRAVANLEIFVPDPALQNDAVEKLQGVEQSIQEAKSKLNLFDSLVKSQFIEMFGDPRTNSKSWPVKPLNDVCDTRLGKMLDKKKQSGRCLHPYLANANVQWFRFDLTELGKMDFDEADCKEFELHYGDVLATEGGDVGRCAIWRCEIKNCYFQKAIHRIRCHEDVLIPEYFVWTFKMKADLGLFKGYVSQSTIAHLTGAKIKQVPLQLPPLDLQCRFADLVAQVDRSKAIARKQIEKLQLLYDSLAQEYFGD